MGIRILVPKPRHRGGLQRAHRFLWAALGIALCGVAYTVLGNAGMVGVFQAHDEVERLAQAVDEARRANVDLEAQIEALKSDPDTIERFAREEFFLAKPGEKVYLLPSLPPAGDPSRSANEGPPEAGTSDGSLRP